MRQKPARAPKLVDAVTMLRQATVVTHHCHVDGGLTSSHSGASRRLRLDLFDGSSSWPSPTLLQTAWRMGLKIRPAAAGGTPAVHRKFDALWYVASGTVRLWAEISSRGVRSLRADPSPASRQNESPSLRSPGSRGQRSRDLRHFRVDSPDGRRSARSSRSPRAR